MLGCIRMGCTLPRGLQTSSPCPNQPCSADSRREPVWIHSSTRREWEAHPNCPCRMPAHATPMLVGGLGTASSAGFLRQAAGCLAARGSKTCVFARHIPGSSEQYLKLSSWMFLEPGLDSVRVQLFPIRFLFHRSKTQLDFFSVYSLLQAQRKMHCPASPPAPRCEVLFPAR